MKVSYKQLQEVIKETLPPLAELQKGLIFHAFEIEGSEEKGDDFLIDVKVLPDRAADCLSTYGIAREVAAIFNLTLNPIPAYPIKNASLSPVKVNIATEKCRNFCAARVEGVKVGPSPAWQIERLATLEQRSINSIVDYTNTVLLAFGQPLHAYDADNVVGDMVVREASEGETMTTLDGKDLMLKAGMLVIADEVGVLSLAGIKGGNRAAITETTTNLILEAANFDGVSVRKTARHFNLLTDAAKRFENNLARAWAPIGLNQLMALIQEGDPEARFSEVAIGGSIAEDQKQITLSKKLLQEKLSVTIPDGEAVAILVKLGFGVEVNGNDFMITVPFWRVDVTVPENIIEEVGRLYGYDQIPGVPLPPFAEAPSTPNFLIAQKIKYWLAAKGLTEAYGYAFARLGEVEVLKPLQADKPFLRTNLIDGLVEKAELNLKNVLFDTETVSLFEIGTVFHKNEEIIMVGLVVAFTKPKLNKSEEIINGLLGGLGVVAAKTIKTDKLLAVEFPLTAVMVDQLPGVSVENKSINYRSFSPFPRIIRDIAIFVPEGTAPETVAQIIELNLGDLVVRGPILFDQFTKDGKTSLAFRLVFQAFDRTLTDEEIKPIVDTIITELEKNSGFEVRK
jgi:phenylalanyl-tRNA synthetase beta chain